MKKIISLIAVVCCSLIGFSQQNSTPIIVEDEFLYTSAKFPSCHASTIIQADNGDLLVAYFGGQYEGADDVCIWMSRKQRNSSSWYAPVKIANGEPNGILNERKACYNPVLFKMPDGKIVLFFKIGKNVQDWSGWYSVSVDNGMTWSEKQPLPEGFLGPIKNKPEIIGDKLICPSSTEKGWWQIHFEIYDLTAKTWEYIGPIKAKKAVSTMNMPDKKAEPIICIQPSILKLPNGKLQVLCRTKNGRLATSYSKNGGKKWSKVTLTSLPNNNSGTDAVTLSDGRHALVYNDISTPAGQEMGKRTPLCLLIFDSTMTKQLHKITLEDEPESEYSYPAIIQTPDGYLHITYTWKRQRIAYKKIKL